MSTDRDFAVSRRASIRFLTTEEGGRQSAPSSGVRSQIDLGAFQSSCVIEGDSSDQVLSLGEAHYVNIRLVFPDQAAREFSELATVRLFEGNRLVATGDFL